MSHFQNESGVGFQQPDHVVFFGGKGCAEEQLQKSHSEISFRRIRQTHSAVVVESSNNIVDADAHYTAEKNTGLVVATADCIPLMVFCRQTKRVAAVHAGWRGILNQLTKNTLSALISSGSSQKDFIFYVGPHILQKSFQTDEDVFLALTAAHPGLSPAAFSTFVSGKYYISLIHLMEYQIQTLLQKPFEIFKTGIDTMTNDGFYSYRRGKHSRERNLSFISLR